MWYQTSFQKVLEQQLQKDMGFKQPQEPVIQDPANLAYLIGRIPKVEFQKKSKYQAVAPEIKAPAHLNETEKEAYLKFHRWGMNLPRAFSILDLKNAFRKLALKMHPDQGGTQSAFLELKSTYLILRQSIK